MNTDNTAAATGTLVRSTGQSPFDHVDTPLVDALDVALLDLDGVVYRGPAPVPHAAAAVAAATAAGLRVHYVTNNAARPPQEVSDHLSELQIPTTPDQVTTAAQAAATLIAEGYPVGTHVLILGGAGLEVAVTEVGMIPVRSAEQSPAVVVQGLSRTMAWPELAEAVYAINSGAEFIASNLDSTLPTERGMAPGNGALVAAVSHATGVSPRSTGKPAASIFHQAARRAAAGSPIVVGDRLDTDIAGACAAGYPSLHVLTGVDGPRELLAARPGERPTLLAPDLRGLLHAHPAVRAHEGGWQCGRAYARWSGSRLEVTDDGVTSTVAGDSPAMHEVTMSMDGLRASCAAAWQSDAEMDSIADIHIDVGEVPRQEP